MEEKITIRFFFVGFIAAILATIFTATAFHKSFVNQVESDLKISGAILAESYTNAGGTDYLTNLSLPDLRITLIDPNGTVLLDNTTDPAQLDNHLTHPEIMEATQHHTGEAIRHSDTFGIDVYYYALQLTDGNILRIARAANNRYSYYAAAYPWIILILFGLMVLSILLAVFLTKNLLKPLKNLAQEIDNAQLAQDGKKVYKELVPFVKEIQSQRIQIAYQIKAVADEKNNLVAIIQNMAEGLLVLDMNGKILVSNESAGTYFGQSENLEGLYVSEISDNSELEYNITQALHGYQKSQYINLAGRQMQLFANPVTRETEQVGVICFILDITDKIQVDRMRQEFTANVSHELKTPLTSISGYAEMIETGMAKQDDIRRFAAIIHKEAGRLLILISDIIKLSEIDEANNKLSIGPVDLLELAEECADILTLSAKNHYVSLHVEGEQAIVQGNHEMLSELVYNLCDNAIRYNKKNGTVTILVQPHQLTVADTGIGIPASHQSRIFERFYRVDKSRSKETGGTGLGLAIVKHIAEQHNAKIELHSNPETGTQIKIIFPLS